MAFDARIDVAAQRAIVSLHGSVDGRDLVGAIAQVYEDPNWRLAYDALWDATGITELILEPDDIERVMEASQKYTAQRGHGRTALVVTRDMDAAIAKLIVHRHKNVGQQRERRAFERIEEAEAWLDGEAGEQGAAA